MHRPPDVETIAAVSRAFLIHIGRNDHRSLGSEQLSGIAPEA